MSEEGTVGITDPLILNTMIVEVNGKEIEIPLKRPKRTISLRVDESVIHYIDKTVVKTQFKTPVRISRTMLIERVVEALGLMFSMLNNEVESITITCRNKHASQTIKITLCPEC